MEEFVTQGKTLRALAGLDPAPCTLGGSALVMIDCQNTYRSGVMALHGVEEALMEARKLLARARSAGTGIFHIAHDAGPGTPYDRSAEIGRIADVVAPREGEPVITKSKPNSFVGTDLDERLRAAGVTELILAGFMTHMCVNSTARGAFNLGYKSTVVAHATATRDLPLPGGGVVGARALHQASLAAIADLFAVVVDGADDLRP